MNSYFVLFNTAKSPTLLHVHKKYECGVRQLKSKPQCGVSHQAHSAAGSLSHQLSSYTHPLPSLIPAERIPPPLPPPEMQFVSLPASSHSARREKRRDAGAAMGSNAGVQSHCTHRRLLGDWGRTVVCCD